MANTLKFKRGLVSTIPTAALGEPLFTTDTFDLYIGNGTGNTRFQKYIASGATTQILRGDGSLYTFPLAISSPTNGQVLKYNGTSWVNDSDSGITGSGLAGQVAYFTGATTQGGSNNLFWDATNNRLGIGTITPRSALDVTGDIITSWADRFIGTQFQDGSSYQFGIKTITANRDLQILSKSAGSPNGNGITFHTGTTPSERMRINYDGNVLIGSTSDLGFRFQVTGNSYSSGSSTSASFIPSGSTIPTNGMYLPTTNTLGWSTNTTERMRLTANGRLLLGTTTEGTQRLQVAGDVKFDADAATNGFYWDNTNKRLGLGTTSPLHPLDVTSSGNTILYIRGGTSTSLSRLVFGTSANTDRGFIDYDNTAASRNMSFKIAEVERMRIDANGSVGIGTTSLTGVILRLSKTLTGSTSPIGLYIDTQIQSDVTSNAFIIRSNPSTAAASFTLGTLYHFSAFQGSIGASSAITNQYGFFVDTSLTGATNNYGFYGNIASGTGRWNLYMNGTAANYMAGDLLIGNTSDAYSAANRNIISLNGATDSLISMRGGGTSFGYIFASSSVFDINANSRPLTFSTTGSERARIFNNGNFAIGSTTDSGEKLQVTGTMKVTGASSLNGGATIPTGFFLNFGSSGIADSSGALQIRTQANPMTFSGHDGGARNFYFNGYVGINTNTPGYRLDVNGDARIVGAATFSSSVTAASLVVDTNTLVVDATNDRVGIGTTTPDAKLRVAGAINSTQAIFGNVDGRGLAISTSLVGGTNEAGVILNARSSVTSGALIFQTDSTEQMRIDATGVKATTAIAIGTTPDTNKPFKILKAINGTVGINFENTSTGSSAFSAIQFGTDVSGGTAFGNLVYASSGITEAGVYKPSGTALINTGSGGLNFLSVSQPIRFFTSTGNGTERVRIKNEGQVHFVPLAAAPTTSVQAGDVYYDSTLAKLRCYDGIQWQDLF